MSKSEGLIHKKSATKHANQIAGMQSKLLRKPDELTNQELNLLDMYSKNHPEQKSFRSLVQKVKKSRSSVKFGRSRKVSRKVSRRSRKVSRKVSRRSRKVSRKVSRRSRKVSRKVSRRRSRKVM